MKAAGPSPKRDTIVPAIAKSDFDSIVGHVAFQPSGELKQPFIFLYSVKGGKLELLDDATNPLTKVNKGVITNSNTGTINLANGGDIEGLASVSNSGMIELQRGTLNLDVNVTNSANGTGGNIQVDSGAKLVLGTDTNPKPAVHGGVTGGTVTVNAGGELDLTGSNTLSAGALVNKGQVNVTGANNVLDDVTVSNTGTASAIDITGGLTLQNGTAITNADANSGETVESSGTLTLNDTSSITNGKLVNLGTVKIEASTGAKFDNVDISGGSITGNSATMGGGVYSAGTGSSLSAFQTR